jgi:tRNA threonylcarbamoyladenosine modification (KEOPS) complex Cgi121 subunit
LLVHIDEFRKYAIITGFKNIRIRNKEEFLKKIHKEKQSNVEIQFFDAKSVATWQHLYFALLNALTAFRNSENISKSLAMETMIYASAQRQIRKATELIGIGNGMSEIALLIVGDNSETLKSALSMISKNVNMKNEDATLELSEQKQKIIREKFGISDLELKTIMKKGYLNEALTNLVIERMALLTTQR